MTVMEWLLVATGFVGALTLRHYSNVIYSWFVAPPSATVHFSPKGGCTEAIVAELAKACRDIHVLAYGFTNKPIAQALVDAKARGVNVEIVLDDSNEKEAHTDLQFFIEQGLSPLIDSHHAIAHNKVMIVDGKIVITGSFNFTNQAEHENAENMVILKGHPELAKSFYQNFRDHKAHARAPQMDAAHKPVRKAA